MSPTVLVVEDNDLVRRLVGTYLTRAGFAAVLAATPADAVAAAREHGAIDALLTDVSLPGTTGVDLARVLTQIFPSLRVLYMSGLGDLSWAGPFIPKPFTAEELTQALTALLAGD